MRITATTGRNYKNSSQSLRAVAGHEGLRIPVFLSVCHEQAMFRRVHDTARWIGQLIQANATTPVNFNDGDSGIVITPTAHFRIDWASAGRADGGIPNWAALGSAFKLPTTLTYERRAFALDNVAKHKETLAIDGRVIYDRFNSDVMPNERQASIALQEFTKDVLTDLGYGNPSTALERSTLLVEQAS